MIKINNNKEKKKQQKIESDQNSTEKVNRS